MTRYLVIAGHGLRPNGSYDPGANGNGITEARFLRDTFIPAMKKYAPLNMDFHTKNNFYAYRTASSLTGYDEIIELHLDAASASAEDGHVIIYKGYEPDAMDIRIRDTIDAHVGADRYSNGFSYRDNLHNLNVFADRGIGYRLVELAFITNKQEMDYLKSNYNSYAKDLVASITGKEVEKVASIPNAPNPTDQGRYRLETGILPTAESLVRGKEKIDSKFPWLVYEKAESLELNPGYRIRTGTFIGRNVAEFYAGQLKKLFGWTVYILKD